MTFFDRQDNEVEFNNYTQERIDEMRRGYQLYDELFLVCPSCKAKIVSIYIVKLDCPFELDGETYNEVMVGTTCPDCNFPSFKQKLTNVKVYFGGVEPYIIDDITNEGNKVNIKVVNERKRTK